MISTGHLLVCFGLFVAFASGGHWGYKGDHGKAHWGETYSHCGHGKKQSPIHLETEKSVYKEDLPNLHLEHININKETDKMFIFNNGHTLQLSVHADFMIMGGSLGDKYKIAQLHFHWGKTDERGSEHHKDHKAYPLEMHIVSYDTERFNSLSEAVGQENGIAVIGVFFQVKKFHNKHFDPILHHIEEAKQPDPSKHVKVPVFNLQHLLPMHTKYYFRYEGSLTTPGCNETVVWTVMDMPNFIGGPQLEKFRTLMEDSGTPLVDNYRDVQPINDREIHRSFPSNVEYVIYHDIQVNEAADASVATHNQLGYVQLTLGLITAAIFSLMH